MRSSERNLNRLLRKWVISLFLCRARVHPPTSHCHLDLNRCNLYLCSEMEDMQELASCVGNYVQVKGCRAVCLGLWFEARKEGREGGGGQESKRKKESSSEAEENLVILRTATSLMDSVCVCFSGRSSSAEKGCVYPICSLPLPCGRKTTGRLPVWSQRTGGRPRDSTGEEEREVGHRGRPRNLLVEGGAECVCVCARACACARACVRACTANEPV